MTRPPKDAPALWDTSCPVCGAEDGHTCMPLWEDAEQLLGDDRDAPPPASPESKR